MKAFPGFGPLLLTVLLVLGTAPACHQEAAPTAPAAPAFGKLSIDDVAGLIQAGKAVIFDVNGRERYAKGHLPGAKWAAFDEVKASELPPDKDQTLVFYCANEMCSASHDAAEQAVAFGYRKVFVMPAGIYGWEKAGKPSEHGP